MNIAYSLILFFSGMLYGEDLTRDYVDKLLTEALNFLSNKQSYDQSIIVLKNKEVVELAKDGSVLLYDKNGNRIYTILNDGSVIKGTEGELSIPKSKTIENKFAQTQKASQSKNTKPNAITNPTNNADIPNGFYVQVGVYLNPSNPNQKEIAKIATLKYAVEHRLDTQKRNLRAYLIGPYKNRADINKDLSKIKEILNYLHGNQNDKLYIKEISK